MDMMKTPDIRYQSDAAATVAAERILFPVDLSIRKPTHAAALAAARATFDFEIKQVVQSGEIALMHTEWRVSSPTPMTVYAIEVARRQPDGTWCWLIGDPFTVGKHTG